MPQMLQLIAVQSKLPVLQIGQVKVSLTRFHREFLSYLARGDIQTQEFYGDWSGKNGTPWIKFEKQGNGFHVTAGWTLSEETIDSAISLEDLRQLLSMP